MPATLDIEQQPQLLAYLRETGRVTPDEMIDTRVLSGGVSNRTVWIRRATGEEWVLKQALAKLRVKVDWFSDPSRIHCEALGLKYLERLAPPGTITPLIFEDAEHHLLAMAAVPQPHENWKTTLLAGQIDFDHVEQFAALLGQIHRESWLRRDELDLPRVFDERSFFETLRIEPYYQYTASQVPQSATFFERLISDTRQTRVALTHGDYSPKNILVRDGRLVLLDHEVIHWGDPAFDIGFAMAHFLSKGHHLPQHRKQFGLAALNFWVNYCEEITKVPWTSVTSPDQAARHTLGCLLARVAGRSPLEYLSESERATQREVVTAMMNDDQITSVNTVICEFLKRGS